MNKVIQYDNSMIDYSREQEWTPDQDYDFWWLELNEKGIPIRELAFDKAGKSCYAAPHKTDRGVWCDSNIYFDLQEDHDFINQGKFDNEWKSFLDK